MLAASQNPCRAQGVSDERFAKLARGVNVNGWFSNSPIGYPDQHLRSYITADDMTKIRSMGFNHIRLSVDSALLFQDHLPNQLNAHFTAHLDRALDMAHDASLAVIVDMHPLTGFKRDVVRDRPTDYQRFWGALASHLRTRSPEEVFLEVLNEPEDDIGDNWPLQQKSLIAKIRAHAPQHTIIASGAHFSNRLDLIFGVDPQPGDDPNVVYNFHFYDDFGLTHQGVPWLDPSPPTGVTYPNATLNAQAIADRLQQVRDWASRNNADPADDVRVMANEFGVYKPFAPTTSRLQWTRDVREALENRGIAWNVWEYTEGFAVMDVQADGRRLVDPAMAEALGLSFHRRFQSDGHQGVTGVGNGPFITAATGGFTNDWDTGLQGTTAFAGSDRQVNRASVQIAWDQGHSGQAGDHAVKLTVDVSDVIQGQEPFWFGGVSFDADAFSFAQTGLEEVVLTAAVLTDRVGGRFQVRLESSQGNYIAFNGTGTGQWQTIGGLLTSQEAIEMGRFNPWATDASLLVVVSFIEEQASWGNGGTLWFDDLALSRPTSANAVPEPATLGLVALGVLMMLPGRGGRRGCSGGPCLTPDLAGSVQPDRAGGGVGLDRGHDGS